MGRSAWSRLSQHCCSTCTCPERGEDDNEQRRLEYASKESVLGWQLDRGLFYALRLERFVVECLEARGWRPPWGRATDKDCVIRVSRQIVLLCVTSPVCFFLDPISSGRRFRKGRAWLKRQLVSDCLEGCCSVRLFLGHSALFSKGFTALLEKGSGLEPGIWDDWSTSVPGRNPLERRAGRLRNGGSCTGSVSRVRGRRGDSSSFDARVTVNSAAAGLGCAGHWEKHTGRKGFHRGHQIRLDDVRGGVCHGGRLWLQSPPFGPPGDHPATAFRGGHLRPLRGE